ncbi:MAG TPA: histidine ammonia-lyase [Phycisphaerales bacterium]|nr:histidine ammonia-lyase [Phycisphaerales bacterium]
MTDSESKRPLLVDGGPLTIAEVVQVARRDRQVRVGDEAMRRLAASRSRVEACLGDGQPHYGINTGFGSLSQQRVGRDDLAQLQVNLVRSHAAGVGDPLPREIVRGMLLLLAASLSRGLSGVRPVVVERLAELLNAGVTPVVPSIGSVGASGDLAPLAHAALVLMGEGRAEHRGRLLSGADALRAAGLAPLTLEAKEGLALLNGTHLMAARGALLCADFERLFDAALAACAMSIDGCMATDAFLDARLHEARRQPGQSMVAERLRALLAGSEIVRSHRENDPRVQDPYSFRCAPAVLGAAWDAAGYVKLVVERELHAVTDNPLVFDDGAVVSGGNFHGLPIAIPLDVLSVPLAHVAGIAERRIFTMLAGSDPASGLRPFLAARPGLQSGLMIVQYTAAACCNELAGLAAPASVVNLPTSAGMEDYNSFGPRAAAKAARALELARYVVAIELLCAAEAVECHRPLRSGDGVERVHAMVRSVVPRFTEDRPLSEDVERIVADMLPGL